MELAKSPYRRHYELMTAKTDFSATMMQHEALRALAQTGWFGTHASIGVLTGIVCEPTYREEPDGTWLMGLRFNVPSATHNGSSANSAIRKYLPIGYFDVHENEVDPHPELVETLKFADIEWSSAMLESIAQAWENGWNSMIMPLAGKVIFAEDYTLMTRPPDMQIERVDPYF